MCVFYYRLPENMSIQCPMPNTQCPIPNALLNAFHHRNIYDVMLHSIVSCGKFYLQYQAVFMSRVIPL